MVPNGKPHPPLGHRGSTDHAQPVMKDSIGGTIKVLFWLADCEQTADGKLPYNG